MKVSLGRSLLLLLVLVTFSTAVSAKDEWIQVKSKNFYLIGNASEKDIRKVATRLEEFRETFRLLFQGLNLVSPIGTNVVVFKSDGSYKPFKPKRADGKLDTFVAGYFQPGRDVNYITLSMEGEDVETFRTIFHEYVHFIVNTNFGKSEVPPWINEGLAEFYSTFQIEQDQVVKLGLLINYHLEMLAQSKFIPLGTLFSIKNSQLLNSADHGRSIFYAESWALMHYLIQGGKGPALAKFLNVVLKGGDQEKAFAAAFGQDYATMEAALRKYVQQSKYVGTQYTFEKKLTFDADLQVSPLSPPMTNAYLGDLLYHVNREDDSEAYLTAALKDDPSITMAIADLGMVKFSQRKFDEARKYLETAIQGDQRTAYALYRYAYLLSREGTDEYGISREYSPDTLAKMRDALRRAMKIEPGFTESYDLLAFIDISAHDDLDEAAKVMQTALKQQPGNDEFALRLAEIYMQQEKLDDARKIADRISHGSDDPHSQERSANILKYVEQRQQYDKQREEFEQRRKDAGSSGNSSGPIEVDSTDPSGELRAINHGLREPLPDEKRVIGTLERIDCSKRPIVFSVKTGDGVLLLTSSDFQSLTLAAFVRDATNVMLGCDAKLAPIDAVITYKQGPPTLGNKGPRGQLMAIEFVPKNFRILTAQELANSHPQLVHRAPASRTDDSDTVDTSATSGNRSTPPTRDDIQDQQRDAIRQGMRGALHKPADGEKREMAFLDKIECGKAFYFVFHNADGVMRLLNDRPESLHITIFTPALDNLQLGCTLKPVEYPAVIVYKPSSDPKATVKGTIVSIDFVPKDFTLD